jgi:hypothetical protein
MVAWEVLRDIKPGQYTHRDGLLPVGQRACTFLIEAILVGSGQKSMPIPDIERHPALFPFRTATSSSLLRTAKQFSVHRQGVDMDIVELSQSEPSLRHATGRAVET